MAILVRLSQCFMIAHQTLVLLEGRALDFPQGMSCVLRSLIGSNYLKDRSESGILIPAHMVSKTR